MKKSIFNPGEKEELDKMWPKGEEFILNERPEGMSFEEYKTRKRHEREMMKFRNNYYGFEPHGKIKKKTDNSRPSKGGKGNEQPKVSGTNQTGNKTRQRTPVKK